MLTWCVLFVFSNSCSTRKEGVTSKCCCFIETKYLFSVDFVVASADADCRHRPWFMHHQPCLLMVCAFRGRVFTRFVTRADIDSRASNLVVCFCFRTVADQCRAVVSWCDRVYAELLFADAVLMCTRLHAMLSSLPCCWAPVSECSRVRPMATRSQGLARCVGVVSALVVDTLVCLGRRVEFPLP